MDLKSLLFVAAEMWCAANDAPMSRIGKLVMGGANFFERLSGPKVSCTTASLEKFADFFADAGSWPEGRIPAEVGEFIHRVAGISPEADASPDHENGDIGVPPSSDVPAPGVVGSSRPTASLLEDGGSDSLPSSIEGERLDGGTIPSAAPGELFTYTSCGWPGMRDDTGDEFAAFPAPVICPDCDLRIDDARVLQCQHAICPRRVAA